MSAGTKASNSLTKRGAGGRSGSYRHVARLGNTGIGEGEIFPPRPTSNGFRRTTSFFGNIFVWRASTMRDNLTNL